MVAAPDPAHDPDHDDDLLVLAPHEQADPDVLALAGTQLKKNEPLYMADILKNVLRHIQRFFALCYSGAAAPVRILFHFRLLRNSARNVHEAQTFAIACFISLSREQWKMPAD